MMLLQCENVLYYVRNICLSRGKILQKCVEKRYLKVLEKFLDFFCPKMWHPEVTIGIRMVWVVHKLPHICQYWVETLVLSET